MAHVAALRGRLCRLHDLDDSCQVVMQVIFITIFGDRGLPDGVHLAGAVVMSQHTGRVINHGVLRVRTIRTVETVSTVCMHGTSAPGAGQCVQSVCSASAGTVE